MQNPEYNNKRTENKLVGKHGERRKSYGTQRHKSKVQSIENSQGIKSCAKSAVSTRQRKIGISGPYDDNSIPCVSLEVNLILLNTLTDSKFYVLQMCETTSTIELFQKLMIYV